MTRLVRALLRAIFVGAIVSTLVIGGGAAWLIHSYGRNLPDFSSLESYQPAIGSKVYAADGSLLAEYATQRRIFVPFDAIPRQVVDAFLAAEDRQFYQHNGVNPMSIARAALSDILRLQRGERPIGASTITQQLVRHFLLNDRVSLARKVKEALLAYRIEHYLSKDQILGIYLNEIYLGAGAYGVGQAAETYFHKPLDQLSLAETAFLAALPKAPNSYNPLRNPQAAKARRDWVLAGMAAMGWVSRADADAAIAEPIDASPQPPSDTAPDSYFAEEVRRELVARFGEKQVYEGGLRVRTSFVQQYEAMAETAFRDGLIAYDRRHGWRGPVAHLPDGEAAQAALSSMADPPGIGDWQLAAVTSVNGSGAQITLRDGSAGRIPLDLLSWARRTLPHQDVGAPVYSAREVLSPGDIVLVSPASEDHDGGRLRRAAAAVYGLRQIPDASGGIVAMDPKSGRVFALVGGWDFRASQFDRAVQAMRQPGSAIKPFVYVTALENGYTPSSIIDDSPIALPQGPGLPEWEPVNYEGGYVGPTTLTDALVHSRNLATVHLATQIGMRAIARTVDAFGVMDKMPLYYSMALGAGDTTLLRLTAAYAMLDDGGDRLVPSLIDSVQDRSGQIIYQKGVTGCPDCFIETSPTASPELVDGYQASGRPSPAQAAVAGAGFAPNAVLYKPAQSAPLIKPLADAQIIAMMQGVVQHGTGIKVAAVGKPLAGKTGTTNDWHDAWFVGFSPDLTAGVYVGFDTPRTLGRGEAGGDVAAPIFRDFMEQALKDAPTLPFPTPPGADIATVDARDGQPASSDDPDAVTEPFQPGTAPGAEDGSSAAPNPDDQQDQADQGGQPGGPGQGNPPNQPYAGDQANPPYPAPGQYVASPPYQPYAPYPVSQPYPPVQTSPPYPGYWTGQPYPPATSSMGPPSMGVVPASGTGGLY